MAIIRYLGLLVLLIINGITVSLQAEPVLITELSQPPQIKPASNFELPDLNDQVFSNQQFMGKVVVLHIWATWCEPCRQEMPILEQLQQQFPQLVVLGIAEDSKISVEQFLKQTPLSFPILIDQFGKLLRDYKIKGFPTTYLINKKGFLTHFAVGTVDWQNPNIINKIKLLSDNH